MEPGQAAPIHRGSQPSEVCFLSTFSAFLSSSGTFNFSQHVTHMTIRCLFCKLLKSFDMVELVPWHLVELSNRQCIWAGSGIDVNTSGVEGPCSLPGFFWGGSSSSSLWKNLPYKGGGRLEPLLVDKELEGALLLGVPSSSEPSVAGSAEPVLCGLL